MSFPATSILDSGAGADANLTSGNWRSPASGSGVGFMKRLSNQIAGSTSTSSDGWWSPSTFGPDCECYVEVAIKPGSGDVIGAMARLQQVSTTSTTIDGYIVYASAAAGTDSFIIAKIANGVFTTLATYSQEFIVGDKVGIECVGDQISAWYYNSGTTTWTKLGTITDTTYSAAGNIGLRVRGTTVRAVNFGGGTIVVNTDAATVPSVTTPSISEFANYVDAQVVSDVTSISGVDVLYADAATVVGKTTPSGTDNYTGAGIAYTDSATVSSKTAPSAIEVFTRNVDSATITSRTTPGVTVELQTGVSIRSTGQTVVGATLVFTIVVDIPTATGNPTNPIDDTGDGFVGSGNVVGGETSNSYTGVAGYWGSSDDDNGAIV